MPAATAEDAPPLEPPGVCGFDHGFSVGPRRSLSVSRRKLNAGVLVRPTITAPAAFRFATTGLSSVAMRSRNATTPLVVARARLVDVLLDGDGHAVQRPERITACHGRIRTVGRRERVPAEIDRHRVQPRIDVAHAGQAGGDGLAGRDRAPAYGLSDAGRIPPPDGVGHGIGLHGGGAITRSPNFRSASSWGAVNVSGKPKISALTCRARSTWIKLDERHGGSAAVDGGPRAAGRNLEAVGQLEHARGVRTGVEREDQRRLPDEVGVDAQSDVGPKFEVSERLGPGTSRPAGRQDHREAPLRTGGHHGDEDLRHARGSIEALADLAVFPCRESTRILGDGRGGGHDSQQEDGRCPPDRRIRHVRLQYSQLR